MASRWKKIFPDATENKVQYLIDGKDSFESIRNAIRTAKTSEHYIYIMGWMLDIDMMLVPSGWTSSLRYLLLNAISKGVEIRILVWENPIKSYQKMNLKNIPELNKLSNTLAFFDSETFSTNESKNYIAQFVPFVIQKLNKWTHIFKELDILYDVLRYCITKNVGSHHDKVIIVKGEEGLISFCGGIDINKNRFQSYHDTHCKVEGPAAYEILERFKRRWKNHPQAKNHPLKGDSEPKPKEILTGVYAQAVGTYNDPKGKTRDRSLKDAYLKIIDNAKNYIYIEDQYVVNQEVAKHLNRKIKEKDFLSLIIVTQDSIETTDIMIPDRKRKEFWDILVDGLNEQERDKVELFSIDVVEAKKGKYHAGVHAKTLIVDDEIAIIGSANVNQRSFTNDSETSLIFFEDPSTTKYTLPKRLRLAIWNEFLRARVSAHVVDSWRMYCYMVVESPGFSILRRYKSSIEDLDVRINAKLRNNIVAPIVAGYLLGNDLQKVSVALNPATVTNLFTDLWDYVIDPEVK